ncbi:hypothetical protein [Symmachiella dynata]|uniref:hypothetical protein n=1 Tax=Symmachiella dynata TaxID=2527995 RepID=UPI001E3866CE|nr:hypothetical protein [Symmachiella dynata]
MFEVAFPDLQVMLPGGLLRISQPLANDMQRELSFQFRLPTGTAILVEPWNLISDSGTGENSQRLGSEVAFSINVTEDSIFLLWCQFLGFQQVRQQLCEDRHNPLILAAVLCLWTVYDESLLIPKEMTPAKTGQFRRASEATVASQCDNEPILRIGGIQDLPCHLRSDFKVFVLIHMLGDRDAGQRVDLHQFISNRKSEDLPGCFQDLVNIVL